MKLFAYFLRYIGMTVLVLFLLVTLQDMWRACQDPEAYPFGIAWLPWYYRSQSFYIYYHIGIAGWLGIGMMLSARQMVRHRRPLTLICYWICTSTYLVWQYLMVY
ncbi:hypothetical protein [Parapedobacter tibetensis]|uniref:hypothetical protein n=1 Tax=Parapedobacter tibetensis TaxID=2972951 RepID=UPI00214DB01D|nr:hypothetical protein [Parapedobacter tibetensis]